MTSPPPSKNRRKTEKSARSGNPGKEVRLDQIDDNGQLVRYALNAQVEMLRKQNRGMTQSHLAALLGISEGTLSKYLNGTPTTKDFEATVSRFDRVAPVEVPALAATGGVSALSVRLRGQRQGQDLTARVPASWRRELLAKAHEAEPGATEFDVLLQASSLLDMCQNATDPARQVGEAHRETLDKVITRLIRIGASPPTPRNVDALILIGNLAAYVFGSVHLRLDADLAGLPLGFRVWRAVTTIIRFNRDDGQSTPSGLPEWVRGQLMAAEQLRELSLFPGRSLDLEAAIEVPAAWSPSDDDWVSQVLWQRAGNAEAVVRERGTAAHGLWERALDNKYPSRADITARLSALCKTLLDEADKADDVTLGLRWVAATLDHVVRKGWKVCTTWPETEEPCVAVVQRATTDEVLQAADIPKRMWTATRTLVEHSLLQNSGVHRRHAVDTLAASGWTEQILPCLALVLKDPETQSWLRCRALFVVSFLHQRGPIVDGLLMTAFAKARTALHRTWSRGAASEMHAALFAMGDCYGASDAQEEEILKVRRYVDPLLPDLLASTDSEEKEVLYRVARAAAYLILVTAHADPEGSFTLLERLQGHKDRATSRLSRWALDRRFFTEGKTHRVRPIHLM